MANITDVTVAFDSHILLHLCKSVEQLPLPKDLKLRSGVGLMTVVEVNKSEVRIRAEVAKWVYQAYCSPCPKCSIPGLSPSIILSEYKLLRWSANVRVGVDKKWELGWRKATKKRRFPERCQVQVIYVLLHTSK
jgi:hypothetical protein